MQIWAHKVIFALGFLVTARLGCIVNREGSLPAQKKSDITGQYLCHDRNATLMRSCVAYEEETVTQALGKAVQEPGTWIGVESLESEPREFRMEAGAEHDGIKVALPLRVIRHME